MAKIELDEAKIWVETALGLHAHDLTKAMANRYQVSNSTAAAALKQLELAGVIKRSGPVNRPVFEAASDKTVMQSYSFPLGDIGQLWENDFSASLSEQLSASQRQLLKTSFVLLANNAAQHSRGTYLHVVLEQSAAHVEMSLQDNGVGVFKQIVNATLATDTSAAVALLSSLQTTPKQSADIASLSAISGLVSAFDYFLIEANGAHFPLSAAPVEADEEELFEQGTTVIIELSLHS